MTSFRVDDMTCGRCSAAIIQALRAVAPDASIQVDLASHKVDIDAPSADVSGLRNAIEGAGYTAVLLEEAAAKAAGPAPKKSACCCG